MKQHYFFDTLSTTPCLNRLARTLCDFQIHHFGNPSSDHTLGRTARSALEKARSFFAECFGIPTHQVTFTASGTEANNLAIQGVVLHELASGRDPRTLHVISSQSEHPSVLRAAESLRDWGVKVDIVSITPSGEANIDEVLSLLTEHTTLVSLMHVNNILGTLQPVEEWAKRIRSKAPSVVIHADGIQAFGKTRHPTSSSEIDLYSLSSHKFRGPKGAGALIQLHPVALRPLMFGGGQEFGLRSGTQATANLAAFAEAAEIALAQSEKDQSKLQSLRSALRDSLAPLIESGRVVWNSPVSSLPHIVHLSTPKTPTPLVTHLLDQAGFCVSRGSACASGKPGPDPLLSAMGRAPEVCRSPLRVGLSAEMTPEDLRSFVGALTQVIAQIDRFRVHS